MTTYAVVYRATTGAVVVLGPLGFSVLAPSGEEIGLWHGKFQARAIADNYEKGTNR